MIFIEYNYEVNLSVVILYDVGMACLHAFKELFKLRICVKREGKAETVRAENFRKIGQTSRLNW